MKKSISKISICLVIVMLFTVMFSSCGLFGSGSDDEKEDTLYTILYNDGRETRTIQVKNGEVYSISYIPSKDGYDFLGLYDSEAGGTQYVTASGVSVSAFTDKKNMTLFPKFKPKEYTVVLDYGEGVSTDITQFKIERDAQFPPLPADVYVSDKHYMNFIGWYSDSNWNTQSIKVSGADGVSDKTFNADFAGLLNGEGKAVLHARFEKQQYTVTFYDNKYNVIKEVTANHGDDIDTVSKGIKIGGQNVVGWTRYPGGTTRFEGAVEENLELYPFAYLQTKNIKFSVDRCEQDNGYKPTSTDIGWWHSGYEVVELETQNLVQNEDSSYSVAAAWYPVTLNIKLLSNPGSLPITGSEQNKYISSDTYQNAIYGTNISGTAVGKGAYYVCIEYTDGSRYEKNATDIFNGKKQGDSLALNIPNETGKTITKISVVVVYEIFAGAPGVMGIWWKDFPNYRCSAVLNIK